MSIEELYKRFLNSKGVSTDTRKELNGKIFFALKGDNFNGNKYAQSAVEKGALLAVIDEPQDLSDERFVVVDNVLNTLQHLANFHRKQLSIPILGITGSNGKTTSKELIYSVLKTKYNTYATQGNFNNHVGVPLSLLAINEAHEFAVIEMGANKINDIKELCEICEPNFGLITNIGNAHLEGFGGKQGVVKAKRALFDYVRDNSGTIFVNLSENEVVKIAGSYTNQIIIGEKDQCNYVFKLKQSEPFVKFNCVSPNDIEFNSELYGLHNYQNLKMAAAIGLYFKVDPKSISFALENYKSENNRSQIIEKEGVTIYLDAYNANPTSMKSALQSFANLEEATKKLVVLGDMLELGDEAIAFHKEILDIVKEIKSEAVLIGPIFKSLMEQFPQFQYFEEIDDFNDAQSICIKEYQKILVKGSRGIKLEDSYFLKTT
jgi:UDP-N-acetylmuramoyl-tripeptide--D-alanyl-D-alanine ligase